MKTRLPAQATALLRAWRNGDPTALDELIPLVHLELLALARRYMRREGVGHTLQSTALVNEAFLRLIDMGTIDWQNRAHFLAVAARQMRRILIDHARARNVQKRGGGALRVSLSEALPRVSSPPDVLDVHAAVNALTTLDPRRGAVVELRLFGGLTIEETAAALDVSPDTVVRDWKLAKAWLARELERRPTDGSRG